MDIFMDNSWLHVWEYKKTRSAFLFKRSLEYNVRSLIHTKLQPIYHAQKNVILVKYTELQHINADAKWQFRSGNSGLMSVVLQSTLKSYLYPKFIHYVITL